MDRTTCDLCGNPDSGWKSLFIKDSYLFVKCRRCGFVFTKQIPSSSDLQSAYTKEYYNGSIYKDYAEKIYERRLGYVSFLSYFQSRTGIKKGKLLEIGCATGDFLDAARFIGYETIGIVLSEWAANEALKKGHNVKNCDVDNIDSSEIKDMTFDSVFLWDVFEHLAYPNKALGKIVKILRKGGVITLNTLNISSPTVKYLNEKWSHYFPPYHL